MKTTFGKPYYILLALLLVSALSYGQKKGSLFIIGGGDRSSDLVHEMVKTAQLKPTDYIVVLPMATSVPEESIAYISEQLAEHTQNPVTSFNFNAEQANQKQDWIDSVKNAKLIYVTGGDQTKFMAVAKPGTKLFDALHSAYNQGSTIAGTSAGAAIMSQIMVTGEMKGNSKTADFREVKSDYVDTSAGMGFLTNAIIDQHFIYRSRYNRFLSLLTDHPTKMLIGIDEATAIVVTGNIAKVVGDSQVVVASNPKKLQKLANGKVAFQDAKLSLFTHGESFKLK